MWVIWFKIIESMISDVGIDVFSFFFVRVNFHLLVVLKLQSNSITM